MLEVIHSIYEVSFPENEKKPFAYILDLVMKEKMDMYAILNENQVAGIIITIPGKNATLIDYFAIAPDCRNHGIGHAAMSAFMQEYPDRRLVLEVEYPFHLSKASLEYRRYLFYIHLGYTVQDFAVRLFGVPMAVLCANGSIDFDSYYAILKGAMGEKVKPYVQEMKACPKS